MNDINNSQGASAGDTFIKVVATAVFIKRVYIISFCFIQAEHLQVADISLASKYDINF